MVVLISGASGLIGSEAAVFFPGKGFDIVGVDHDMRSGFSGAEGRTSRRRQMIEGSVRGYRHVDADIRDERAMDRAFAGQAGARALVETERAIEEIHGETTEGAADSRIR